MTEKYCIICNRKLLLMTNSNQKYCDRTLRNCYRKADAKRKREQYLMTQKECMSCRKMVSEKGMKKYCKSCILEEKERKRKAKRKPCKTNGCNIIVRSKKPFCSKCIKRQNLLDKYCRICGKLIGKDQSNKARYCSDDCRDIRDGKKVSTNDLSWEEQTSMMEPKKKVDEITINPFFLQKRGSKGKK